MTETLVRDLPHFIELAASYQPSRNRGHFAYVFRGVTDTSHALIPRVGRDLWPSRHMYQPMQWRREEDALNHFSNRCVAYLEQRPSNRLEVMIHAQHHGLPTRLLDWTFSPMVALYFALNGSERGVDVAVYCGRPPPNLFDSTERGAVEDNPLKVSRDYLVIPPWINRRVAAQQSCFTIHADVKKPIELSPMCRFLIASNNVETMQRQLHYLGVSAETMFPDLDGLARSITFDVFGPLEHVAPKNPKLPPSTPEPVSS